MNGNQITVVGNLTRDPELRYLTSGTPLASFGVASNRFYTKADGEKVEEVSFLDCIAWRELGENVAESLGKGDRVVLTGRIQQRSWETDDGDKRSKLEVIIDEIGPSLRWATASVTKIQRDGAGGGATSSQPPAEAYDEPF